VQLNPSPARREMVLTRRGELISCLVATLMTRSCLMAE